MSAEDNKAVVRRLFEEVINQGNVTAVDELLASHFVLHDPRFDGPCEGSRDEVKNIVEAIRTAFPDVRINIEHQVADENSSVATRWTGAGTHEGEIDSIPPSHLQVEFYGMSLFHLSAGKIDETWNVMGNSLEEANLSAQVPEHDRCRFLCHICPPCCSH